MSELMVKVENVKKEYKLGAIGGTTLRDEIARKVAKVMKKEDPTKKIGAKDINTGEKFMALNGVSFEVKKGEAIGIIGHNGAGKSTLLKLITRITAPTEGNIYLNGRVASMLEVGTGFHPELTGRENIYLNGAILGMTKKEIDAKMEQIIDFSEVRKFIDTPVKRYSSGMYVKLAFSVASHLDSEIMIMDEVLAVGDVAFQNKCIQKMREVADSGRTILYVSHNMSTIRSLCDRCVVLSAGKVIFEGDVDKAISVYLNKFNEEQTTNIDLAKRERPKNSTNKVIMKSLLFCEKEECVYKRGEPIVIKLRWKSIEAVNKVRYRMIVRYSDDTPVGLVQSPIIGDFLRNEEHDTVFEFDTSILADGKYYLSLALFQNDEAGNSVILDHVTRACSFEITSGVNDQKYLNWEHRWWGSISFNNLKIRSNIKM